MHASRMVAAAGMRVGGAPGCLRTVTSRLRQRCNVAPVLPLPIHRMAATTTRSILLQPLPRQDALQRSIESKGLTGESHESAK